MDRNNPERTGYVYFGIFLIIAILAGWVIWKSIQWQGELDRRRVFPVPQEKADSEEEVVIYGKRGVVQNITDILLTMEYGKEKEIITVRKGKKTQVWKAVIEESISFVPYQWSDIKAGDLIYAVSQDDISEKVAFSAVRIYVVEIVNGSVDEIPETLKEGMFE